MTEREIEAYLVAQTRKLRGKAYKLVSPGCQGMPDRLVVLPGGVILFAEMKAPGEAPRPNQKLRQQELQELGCTVFGCVDSKSAVDQLLKSGQLLVSLQRSAMDNIGGV